jgi:hypothetical protein
MSSYSYEIRLGLLLALSGLLWVTLEYAVGLHTVYIPLHPKVTMIYALVPIFIIYKAITHRRDVVLGGALPWGQGIAAGMVVSAVTALLGAPGQWVFHRFINPGFFPAMIDYAVTHGKATQAEAEGYFNLKSYAMQATVGPLAMGLMTSIMVTAVARFRAKPDAGDAQPKA